jgi:polyketide cyclase/dehydrase/lipid transport protein
MKSYEATSLIDATPETIWAILADAANYSAWDSGVVRVEGRACHWDCLRVCARSRCLPRGTGTTKFAMREEYTGPLLPLIWKSMPDLGPSFEKFAKGLKEEAERRT